MAGLAMDESLVLRRFPTVAALDYADHTLIPFDDRSYRWVSVKQFACDPVASDESLLAALVAHWRYRDNYLSPDSHEHDTATAHGPYRVAEITPASFERIEPGQAAGVVEEFCGLDDSRSCRETRGQLQALALSPLSEAVCYRLRDLPHAIHEYGFALLEFRELVVIRREAAHIHLIVMAID